MRSNDFFSKMPALNAMSLLNMDNNGIFLIVAGTCICASLIFALLWSVSGIHFGPGVDKSVGLRREEKGSSSGNLAGQDDRILNPLNFKRFTVKEVKTISHNTKLIRFAIPEGRSLGLPIGRHISARAEIDGTQIIRAYTPTSRTDTTGHFDLLIKRYEYGKLTPYLHHLKAGSTVEIRGPVGRFKYVKNQYTMMGFIAGGTGLTPCLQVIRTILESPEGEGDKTNFVLLFQNRTEADILLREDLETLQKQFPTRIQIIFFLSNPTHDTWAHGNPCTKHIAAFGDPRQSGGGVVQHVRGYINGAAVGMLLAPSKCQYVGICGPSGFNDSMKELLVSAGHDAEKAVYVF